MHIEPGLVTGAKLLLGVATATTAAAFTAKTAWEAIRVQGVASLISRAAIGTVATFIFFELMPHYAVGVSEVHFILGSTLFLILGTAPAAIGLALGLLIQSLFFAQADLPQYGMNVTTLLVPLFAIAALAKRIIAPGTAYVDLSYGQTLALSTAYQAGIVAWVAFWAFTGTGISTESLASVGTFGAAYMLVIVVEPLVDLAVLAAAKAMRGLAGSGLVTPRLHNAA
ncbi:energy-coupling factor ABC transporter permease [Gemmobacter fulvus]|uniref:Energy-coupling factor ABC transporter permease n=1 Tax=Gemmobacter fulvus TaxID=2840474 RepID=A0A975P9J5_9RHOB|nr:energy-coupling factor ABC transporter permease [Gemmobacter fulvus]MBT9244046.1 energy-coupling factor ABC transporter permease [Gemmobacter fulvus]QWK90956.1 energy-coupling factor ABC transporter permease [Gemmobacter fulvus]